MAKDKLDIPVGFADRWETIVSEATKHAFETRQQMMTAAGKRPYKGVPINPAEREAQYMQIRGDTVAQTELLRQNTIVKPDGTVRVRKGFVQSMREMEQHIRKGSMNNG